MEPVREIDVTTHGVPVTSEQDELGSRSKGPSGTARVSWTEAYLPSFFDTGTTEATLLRLLCFLEAFVGEGLADRCTAQSEQASRAATPVDSVSEPSRSSLSPNAML